MKQVAFVSIAVLLAITACGKKESGTSAPMEQAAPASAPATTEQAAPAAPMEQKEDAKKPAEGAAAPAQ
jgi:hypothetical protein